MNIRTHIKRNCHAARQGAAPTAGRAGIGLHLRTWIPLALAGIGAIVAGATYMAYERDLQTTRGRLVARSRIIETRHGRIEYLVEGDGPPVLVVHGAGGGYDQGMLIASTFGGAGFRWIVPSRFGYLRTPLPADASTLAQAEAFADLLDALDIRQVGILAMSGGVPPSLQFARLYPERTSALVLLSSAPYTPLTGSEHKLPVPLWVYHALFKSNFPFWLLQTIAPRSLDTMFDVTQELRAEQTPVEKAFVLGMKESLQPVSWRSDGLNNEAAAMDPQASYHVEQISAPALVVHAQDDHINPFDVGKYTAAHIRGAQFVPLATGGHLLLGHHTEIREMANQVLRQYADSIGSATSPAQESVEWLRREAPSRSAPRVR